MKAKLIKVDDVYRLVEVTKHGNSIIGTTDLDYQKSWSDRCQKLSLKNCQAIERGYDLDELAWEECQLWEHFGTAQGGYIKGFQKALELMGDKKFSEDDVMLGWDAGVMSQSICFTNYFGLKRESELKSHRESYQGNLKPSALQQTEWDVEIEIQRVKDETKIVGAVKGVKGSGNKITTYKSVPKLDADGCLILKRI